MNLTFDPVWTQPQALAVVRVWPQVPFRPTQVVLPPPLVPYFQVVALQLGGEGLGARIRETLPTRAFLAENLVVDPRISDCCELRVFIRNITKEVLRLEGHVQGEEVHEKVEVSERRC